LLIASAVVEAVPLPDLRGSVALRSTKENKERKLDQGQDRLFVQLSLIK